MGMNISLITGQSSVGHLAISVNGSALVLAVVTAISGCSSTSANRAPVEDRRTGTYKPSAVAPVLPKPAPFSSLPSTAQPTISSTPTDADYYTVRPGDTLIRIGLETGQSWRDIRRWNNIENPNQIEVGQVLRVTPNPSPTAKLHTQPQPQSKPQQTNTAVAPAPPSTTLAEPDDQVGWSWPVTTPHVLAGFDELKNKGLDFLGSVGDPVSAAADGRVVYAGAGLRGYGNLIILKHNNTYLTAYAHNQTLLVKEDQTVRKGQKIAEMGNSDSDRVKLHFELRRQGKPVDPLKYLPAR
jgi:lipoprotein NlpD